MKALKNAVAPISTPAAPVAASPAEKTKREKMEVVFEGRHGIVFEAEKELNKEINRRVKVAKIAKTTPAATVETTPEVNFRGRIKGLKVNFTPVVESTPAVKFNSRIKGMKAIGLKAIFVADANLLTGSATPVAPKAPKASNVIQMSEHVERRSMKNLAAIAEMVVKAANEKAAKRVVKSYGAEVGTELAAKNIRFILRHLNNASATELFSAHCAKHAVNQ